MEFRGKELVKGESDATTYPSGRAAATFESPGLYRQGSHQVMPSTRIRPCAIPTARVLQLWRPWPWTKRPPCCAPIDALNRQGAAHIEAVRPSRGEAGEPHRGARAEYFASLTRICFDRRRISSITGRTLFGARPAPRARSWMIIITGSINAPGGRVHAGSGRGILEAGVPAKTEHNRGGSLPA